MGYCFTTRSTVHLKDIHWSGCEDTCIPDPCCPEEPAARIVFGISPATLCSSQSGNGDDTGFISGQVFINGRPAEAGVIVSLSVSNPALGIFVPSATITNESGYFTAVFISRNGPGTGTIIATLPDCPGTMATLPITIINCTQNNATINSFNASLSTICTAGTSTLTGQVFVNGNPAGGVTVQFQVSGNNLGSVNPSSITTNANGAFTATFTADGNTGPAVITATIPSSGSQATTTVTINNCPSAPIITSFIADPPSICASAGGRNTSELSGQVIANDKPAAGVTVLFEVDDPNLGSVNPVQFRTDQSGLFRTVFTARGISDRTANITASLPESGSKVTVPIVINNC
ncbi:hypothetical protein BIV59_22330 [Bacillus sp. MUM 13]|nr:hypothetical protein BIV59_22330 [Bacillus sp. MUM 13]